jgi:hypothetical protein
VGELLLGADDDDHARLRLRPPHTSGGQVVSALVLLIGIGFVALLTGSFAQRFVAPQIAEIEDELEEEKLSAEALALRELKSVQEQLQALEMAIEKMAKR